MTKFVNQGKHTSHKKANLNNNDKWKEKSKLDGEKIEKTSFKSCEKSHKVCQISSFSMFSSSITLHVCSLSCFVNWNQLNLGDIQCYHTSILPLNVSFIISSWWGLSGDRMMNLLNSSGNISWTENFNMRLPLKWVLPKSSKGKLRLSALYRSSAAQAQAAVIHCFVIGEKTWFDPILNENCLFPKQTAFDGVYPTAQEPAQTVF